MTFIRKVKIPEAWARVEWCKQTFGQEIHGGRWWRNKGHLYFKDEECYAWYMMRWA